MPCTIAEAAEIVVIDGIFCMTAAVLK